MSEVTIIQRVLTHYRVTFFERLRAELASQGVDLRVIVGQPTKEERDKGDRGHLSWAEPIQNRYFSVAGHRVVWQPCLRSLRTSDLVIVEQASKLLLNYLLLAWRRVGGPEVAFWGHGVNLDTEVASRTGEYVKRRLAAQADWWFCYTEGTARRVDELGVPANRRTVVQNAIDTTAIQELRRKLRDADLDGLRAELGIGSGPVAVALGSIYPTKRPRFLIETADAVRASLPHFELVVIGDGPSRHIVDEAAQVRPWIHVVGTQTGREMVRYASLGEIVINPGLVGLAVLDAFALGLPMITCDLSFHSPEIAYLRHNENGLVLRRSVTPSEFATEVVGLLNTGARLRPLQASAAESAALYTIDEMVTRFAEGVRFALTTRGVQS